MFLYFALLFLGIYKGVCDCHIGNIRYVTHYTSYGDDVKCKPFVICQGEDNKLSLGSLKAESTTTTTTTGSLNHL